MSEVRLAAAAALTTACSAIEERPFLSLDLIESGAGRLVSGVEVPMRTPPESGVAEAAPGDVLFGKLRPYLAKSLLVDRPAYASTELMCLRPYPDTDPRWLAYMVQSRPFVEWATATSDGTKMPRTSWERARDFRVKRPVVDEQRAIADFLDAETARIDALIDKKRRMIDLLRTRLVVARAGVLSAADDLAPLRRFVRCLDGRRLPLNREERASRLGPYPYWGAGNIVDHIDDYLFDEALVLLGEDGAPFFDDRRDVSFFVTEPVWVNNHIHVLRPNQGIDARWLCHMLNAVDYGSAITGSTRDKLTQDEMMEIRLPWIPLSAQQDAGKVLDGVKERCDRVAAAITSQLALLAERRQALITAAVTGEWSVPGVAA